MWLKLSMEAPYQVSIRAKAWPRLLKLRDLQWSLIDFDVRTDSDKAFQVFSTTTNSSSKVYTLSSSFLLPTSQLQQS